MLMFITRRSRYTASQTFISTRWRRSVSKALLSRGTNGTASSSSSSSSECCFSSTRHQQLYRPSAILPLSRRNLSQQTTSDAWKKLTKRQMADLEDCVSRKVATRVQDSLLEKDLATLRWIHPRIAVSNHGTLQILLKLPSLLHPKLQELKESVKAAAEQEIQKWISDSSPPISTLPPPFINVEAMATKPIPMMARLVEDSEEVFDNLGPGLASVAHAVAVYSCKGGVGKSTVAVNLAYELARRGGRIGLVDLDLYGPSLPVLVRPEDVAVRSSSKGPGMVLPVMHGEVSLLSLGFVAQQSGVPGSGKDNGAAVMKGPFAVKVVAQLLKGTDWGDLDILLLDMPPGTGDVQLGVLQELQLSGAVAVTTPSKLAEVDTRKGIEMFTSLGVPTLAVVENLSYFEVDGVRHYPFGRGLVEEDGSKALSNLYPFVQLPISPLTNTANDNGVPFCLERPENATQELAAFEKLADTVTGELLKYQYGQREGDDFGSVRFGADDESFDLSTLTLSKSSDGYFTVRLFSDTGAVQKQVSPARLRSRDPKSGEEIADSPFLEEARQSSEPSSDAPVTVAVHKTGRKQSPSLIPTKVSRRGRYGFAVEWGDGATIIYSMISIGRAAGGTSNN